MPAARELVTSSQGHATGRVPSGDVEIFYRRFGRPGRTPVLIVHGLSYQSDMFAPETLAKVRAASPRITAIELTGSHDLAGDNPDGLVAAVRDFLVQNEPAMTGAQPA